MYESGNTMKSINTYYTNKEELASFIRDQKIQNSSSLLIQVFSAIMGLVYDPGISVRDLPTLGLYIRPGTIV